MLQDDGLTYFNSGSRIRHGDWRRLSIYSHRIRELTVGEDVDLSQDAQNLIFRRRTSICLTPNLSRLVVSNRGLAIFSQVFVHANLAYLSLYLPTVKPDLEEAIDGLVGKLVQLQEVHFYFNEDEEELVRTFETELSVLLKDLTKLRSLSLPFLTTSLIKSIAEMETLTNVSRTVYQDQLSLGRTFKANPSDPAMNLVDLGITAAFGDILQFLGRLPSLQKLSIRVRSLETSAMLQSFLSAASQSCQRLRSLDVGGIPDNWSFDQALGDTATSSLVHITTLFPLFAINKTLEAFSISWPFEFDINEDDLSAFLPSFGNLRKLYLNCSPIVLNLDPLPISQMRVGVLETIAKMCPHLQELGILIDGTDPDLYQEPPQHMLNLATLNFGLSDVDSSDHRLAHMLSYFCVPSCVLEEGSSLWIRRIKEEMEETYEDEDEDGDCVRWDIGRRKIEKLFRIFRKLRGDRETLTQERDAATRKRDELEVERDMLLQKIKDLEYNR